MPATPAPLAIDDVQRRARLSGRQLLPATGPLEVARAVTALHSTDPASVHLAVTARGGSVDAVEYALYAERSLVRMLAMRRTVFVVPTDLSPTVHAAATRAIAARERSQLIGFIEQNGLTKDGGGMLTHLEDAALAALGKLGDAYGIELGDAVPGLRRQITIAGGNQSLTSRVLFILAAEGRIVRGRPKGSWISSQYQWSAAPVAPPTTQELSTADAQIALARHYLAAYGPATVADLQWWTGWTVGETKRALAGLATVGVRLAGGSTGVVLDTDAEPVAAGPPVARLLPALDPTVMGWKGRGFYLDPDHGNPAAAGSLFDRSGNPGPTIWWDGRVVGGWAQRKSGEIATRMLYDVDSAGREQIESEAARTAEVLGDIRVTPRFRTPLERELVS